MGINKDVSCVSKYEDVVMQKEINMWIVWKTQECGQCGNNGYVGGVERNDYACGIDGN